MVWGIPCPPLWGRFRPNYPCGKAQFSETNGAAITPKDMNDELRLRRVGCTIPQRIGFQMSTE